MYVSQNKELHLVKYIFLVQSKKTFQRHIPKKRQNNKSFTRQSSHREGLVQNSNSATLLVLTSELRSSQTEKIEI